jgi:glycosyltransferase involved in cell wall biosynthesis
MDFGVDGNLFKQKIRNIVLSLVDRIKKLTVGTAMEKKLHYYPFVKKKWFVPNGLSLERNIEHSMTRQEMRTKLGVDENEKLCLLLGWDMKRKGLDIATKAIEYLRKENMNVKLGVIGFGNKPSENVRAFMQQEGVENFEDSIRFLDSVEDIFALHRAIDVYVSASRKEAFSYGLLESISQNTPVVVSDISGTRWAGQYSKCYFYPTEDYVECAAAIKKAIDTGRSESNYKEIYEQYKIENWVEQMTDIYKKLLA